MPSGSITVAETSGDFGGGVATAAADLSYQRHPTLNKFSNNPLSPTAIMPPVSPGGKTSEMTSLMVSSKARGLTSEGSNGPVFSTPVIQSVVGTPESGVNSPGSVYVGFGGEDTSNQQHDINFNSSSSPGHRSSQDGSFIQDDTDMNLILDFGMENARRTGTGTLKRPKCDDLNNGSGPNYRPVECGYEGGSLVDNSPISGRLDRRFENSDNNFHGRDGGNSKNLRGEMCENMLEDESNNMASVVDDILTHSWVARATQWATDFDANIAELDFEDNYTTRDILSLEAATLEDQVERAGALGISSARDGRDRLNGGNMDQWNNRRNLMRTSVLDLSLSQSQSLFSSMADSAYVLERQLAATSSLYRNGSKEDNLYEQEEENDCGIRPSTDCENDDSGTGGLGLTAPHDKNCGDSDGKKYRKDHENLDRLAQREGGLQDTPANELDKSHFISTDSLDLSMIRDACTTNKREYMLTFDNRMGSSGVATSAYCQSNSGSQMMIPSYIGGKVGLVGSVTEATPGTVLLDLDKLYRDATLSDGTDQPLSSLPADDADVSSSATDYLTDVLNRQPQGFGSTSVVQPDGRNLEPRVGRDMPPSASTTSWAGVKRSYEPERQMINCYNTSLPNFCGGSRPESALSSSSGGRGGYALTDGAGEKLLSGPTSGDEAAYYGADDRSSVDFPNQNARHGHGIGNRFDRMDFGPVIRGSKTTIPVYDVQHMSMSGSFSRPSASVDGISNGYNLPSGCGSDRISLFSVFRNRMSLDGPQLQESPPTDLKRVINNYYDNDYDDDSSSGYVTGGDNGGNSSKHLSPETPGGGLAIRQRDTESRKPSGNNNSISEKDNSYNDERHNKCNINNGNLIDATVTGVAKNINTDTVHGIADSENWAKTLKKLATELSKEDEQTMLANMNSKIGSSLGPILGNKNFSTFGAPTNKPAFGQNVLTTVTTLNNAYVTMVDQNRSDLSALESNNNLKVSNKVLTATNDNSSILLAKGLTTLSSDSSNPKLFNHHHPHVASTNPLDWEYAEYYVNGKYIDVNHNEIGFVPPSTRPYQRAVTSPATIFEEGEESNGVGVFVDRELGGSDTPCAIKNGQNSSKASRNRSKMKLTGNYAGYPKDHPNTGGAVNNYNGGSGLNGNSAVSGVINNNVNNRKDNSGTSSMRNNINSRDCNVSPRKSATKDNNRVGSLRGVEGGVDDDNDSSMSLSIEKPTKPRNRMSPPAKPPRTFTSAGTGTTAIVQEINDSDSSVTSSTNSSARGDLYGQNVFSSTQHHVDANLQQNHNGGGNYIQQRYEYPPYQNPSNAAAYAGFRSGGFSSGGGMSRHRSLSPTQLNRMRDSATQLPVYVVNQSVQTAEIDASGRMITVVTTALLEPTTSRPFYVTRTINISPPSSPRTEAARRRGSSGATASNRSATFADCHTARRLTASSSANGNLTSFQTLQQQQPQNNHQFQLHQQPGEATAARGGLGYYSRNRPHTPRGSSLPSSVNPGAGGYHHRTFSADHTASMMASSNHAAAAVSRSRSGGGFKLPDLSFMKLPFSVPPLFPAMPKFPLNFCAGLPGFGQIGGSAPNGTGLDSSSEFSGSSNGSMLTALEAGLPPALASFAGGLAHQREPLIDPPKLANSVPHNLYQGRSLSAFNATDLDRIYQNQNCAKNMGAISACGNQPYSYTTGVATIPRERDSGLGTSSGTGPTHIQDWDSLSVLLPREVVQAYSFFRANANLLQGGAGSMAMSAFGAAGDGVGEDCGTATSLSIDKPISSTGGTPRGAQAGGFVNASPRLAIGCGSNLLRDVGGPLGAGATNVRMRPGRRGDVTENGYSSAGGTFTRRGRKARPLSEPVSMARLRKDSGFEPIEEEFAASANQQQHFNNAQTDDDSHKQHHLHRSEQCRCDVKYNHESDLPCCSRNETNEEFTNRCHHSCTSSTSSTTSMGASDTTHCAAGQCSVTGAPQKGTVTRRCRSASSCSANHHSSQNHLCGSGISSSWLSGAADSCDPHCGKFIGCCGGEPCSIRHNCCSNARNCCGSHCCSGIVIQQHHVHCCENLSESSADNSFTESHHHQQSLCHHKFNNGSAEHNRERSPQICCRLASISPHHNCCSGGLAPPHFTKLRKHSAPPTSRRTGNAVTSGAMVENDEMGAVSEIGTRLSGCHMSRNHHCGNDLASGETCRRQQHNLHRANGVSKLFSQDEDESGNSVQRREHPSGSRANSTEGIASSAVAGGSSLPRTTSYHPLNPQRGVTTLQNLYGKGNDGSTEERSPIVEHDETEDDDKDSISSMEDSRNSYDDSDVENATRRRGSPTPKTLRNYRISSVPDIHNATGVCSGLAFPRGSSLIGFVPAPAGFGPTVGGGSQFKRSGPWNKNLARPRLRPSWSMGGGTNSYHPELVSDSFGNVTSGNGNFMAVGGSGYFGAGRSRSFNPDMLRMKPCPTCYRVRSFSFLGLSDAVGHVDKNRAEVLDNGENYCDCETIDIMDDVMCRRQCFEFYGQFLRMQAEKNVAQRTDRDVVGRPGEPGADKFRTEKIAAKLEFRRKKAMVADLVFICDRMVSLFGRVNRCSQQANSDTTECNLIGVVVVQHLCPALERLLTDRLRPFCSVWDVVRASATLGPATKCVYELVQQLVNDPSLTKEVDCFIAFIQGLLRLHALDCWLSYLALKDKILADHYEPDSFLSSATVRQFKPLFTELVMAIQPLILIPFEFIPPLNRESDVDRILSDTKLSKKLRNLSNIFDHSPSKFSSSGAALELFGYATNPMLSSPIVFRSFSDAFKREKTFGPSSTLDENFDKLCHLKIPTTNRVTERESGCRYVLVQPALDWNWHSDSRIPKSSSLPSRLFSFAETDIEDLTTSKIVGQESSSNSDTAKLEKDSPNSIKPTNRPKSLMFAAEPLEVNGQKIEAFENRISDIFRRREMQCDASHQPKVTPEFNGKALPPVNNKAEVNTEKSEDNGQSHVTSQFVSRNKIGSKAKSLSSVGVNSRIPAPPVLAAATAAAKRSCLPVPTRRSGSFSSLVSSSSSVQSPLRRPSGSLAATTPSYGIPQQRRNPTLRHQHSKTAPPSSFGFRREVRKELTPKRPVVGNAGAKNNPEQVRYSPTVPPGPGSIEGKPSGPRFTSGTVGREISNTPVLNRRHYLRKRAGEIPSKYSSPEQVAKKLAPQPIVQNIPTLATPNGRRASPGRLIGGDSDKTTDSPKNTHSAPRPNVGSGVSTPTYDYRRRSGGTMIARPVKSKGGGGSGFAGAGGQIGSLSPSALVAGEASFVTAIDDWESEAGAVEGCLSPIYSGEILLLLGEKSAEGERTCDPSSPLKDQGGVPGGEGEWLRCARGEAEGGQWGWVPRWVVTKVTFI